MQQRVPKIICWHEFLGSEFQEQQGDDYHCNHQNRSINCLHVDSSDNRRRFHVIVRVNITGYEDAMARDALTWLLCENVVGLRDKIADMNCL